MKTASPNHKNIYYPPGGILMWIIIFLELITFGIALISMVYAAKQDSEVFHASRLMLNSTFGMINTIVLLTSGFFMALSVKSLKAGLRQKTNQYLLLTIALGAVFLVLKSIEYSHKLNAGLTVDYNTFFNYYWILTFFHAVHVLVGMVILISLYLGVRKPKSTTKTEDFEAGAAFWHMCDLIWLLLFPVIYLMF